MNLDITYCSTKGCPIKEKCYRWYENYIRDGNIPYYISVAMFYKPNEDCEYFIEKENRK